MHALLLSAALAAVALSAAAPGPSPPPRPIGEVSAVYELIERVLPNSSAQFTLTLTSSCPGVTAPYCFVLADGPSGGISISGTTASELTSALGVYMREYCNMTIGWPRGGSSNICIPAAWPRVGTTPDVRARVAPYSYIENVCTHSYSLVWYDWQQWSAFIDWQALSGVNLNLGVTGQEEIQWKVLTQFNVSDLDIRTWFNGPAFLTWSRGQNEYGNNIAGGTGLPRSWMKDQWNLQKQILVRSRSLGISSQLPGFQGNVPWALAKAMKDTNITQQGDTGWMYSVDPLFGRIADVWMQTLCADFNCTENNWFQMDGYFDGGTASWRTQGVGEPGSPGAIDAAAAQGRAAPAASLSSSLPACTWSAALPNKYVAGCADGCSSHSTLAAAQTACDADAECGGITSSGSTHFELRQGNTAEDSPSGETSWLITNPTACKAPPGPLVPDPIWRTLGAAAYMGLNRTVPGAIWSFQSWAINGWNTREQASSFWGFVDAVPPGNFVVIDMSVDGSGLWHQWTNASFFGAPYIWTTLHDFGGTDGMKGDLARINEIPFGADGVPNNTYWGTGFTPEGIDQNPVYYEFMTEASFRAARVANITAHIVTRAHRRYGVGARPVPEVDAAWGLLVQSTYAQDVQVQDGTGIPHFPGGDSQFASDRHTPQLILCRTYLAWEQMIAAGAYLSSNAPFRYDLVNLGREVLAQLSTPVSQNFSDATKASTLNIATLTATGQLYIDLLGDVDALVGTDPAFLLGPWLASARRWGANSSDCGTADVPNLPCADYYEWNARSQLTTWNPTPKGASKKPGGPDDYASKHWSGLIRDYYQARASRYLDQALVDAAAGRPLDTAAIDAMEATLAYSFQTSTSSYPIDPVGDAVAMSQAMHAKWGHWFSVCKN